MAQAATITFKGRRFEPEEVGLIEQVVASCRRLSRQELANTICELLANGTDFIPSGTMRFCRVRALEHRKNSLPRYSTTAADCWPSRNPQTFLMHFYFAVG